MDALKDLRWPPALVIVAMLGTIIGLVKLGESLTAVGVFIAGLLAYQGHKQAEQGKEVSEVKSYVNGNNEALRSEVARTKDQMIQMAADHNRVVAQLTAQLPPGATLPRELTDDHLPTGGTSTTAS